MDKERLDNQHIFYLKWEKTASSSSFIFACESDPCTLDTFGSQNDSILADNIVHKTANVVMRCIASIFGKFFDYSISTKYSGM